MKRKSNAGRKSLPPQKKKVMLWLYVEAEKVSAIGGSGDLSKDRVLAQDFLRSIFDEHFEKGEAVKAVGSLP